MVDFRDGIKREVAETKFLIHDLRVERFINEVIHFHVTLNTDLEIYSVEQARLLHGEDLAELKGKAVQMRQAFSDYSEAVRNFSPHEAVLRTGRHYVQAVYDTCDLILNPLWGRFDTVLRFLPPDSRSVRSRFHYRNCIHWICGVFYRIEHFLDEVRKGEVRERFDASEDIQDFTRNVIYGYVSEKSGARVEMVLDRLDPAVLEGNRHRFRRMYFNLVMNAVDAMSNRKVGVLDVSTAVEGDRVVLRVCDNGAGMPPSKIERLLRDRKSLDGELHSLGFVFVRQTVEEFGGKLGIESAEGEGTTVTVSLPFLAGAPADPQPRSRCEKFDLFRDSDAPSPPGRPLQASAPPEREAACAAEDAGGRADCGRVLLRDLEQSGAEHPGCIFGIGVVAEGRVDFFTHRPYERFWNISHEDLSPMYFEATVRGRLERDESRRLVLILKAPQNIREYFEFREVVEAERSPDRYVAMVRNEYVRIANKLMETGLAGETDVYATDLGKFFPGDRELLETEPVPLSLLASRPQVD